jgi:hypothetical protein
MIVQEFSRSNKRTARALLTAALGGSLRSAD